MNVSPCCPQQPGKKFTGEKIGSEGKSTLVKVIQLHSFEKDLYVLSHVQLFAQPYGL